MIWHASAISPATPISKMTHETLDMAKGAYQESLQERRPIRAFTVIKSGVASPVWIGAIAPASLRRRRRSAPIWKRCWCGSTRRSASSRRTRAWTQEHSLPGPPRRGQVGPAVEMQMRGRTKIRNPSMIIFLTARESVGSVAWWAASRAILLRCCKAVDSPGQGKPRLTMFANGPKFVSRETVNRREHMMRVLARPGSFDGCRAVGGAPLRANLFRQPRSVVGGTRDRGYPVSPGLPARTPANSRRW